MQVGLNTRIPLELRQALDQYSRDTSKPIAQIVREALEEYLPFVLIDPPEKEEK